MSFVFASLHGNVFVAFAAVTQVCLEDIDHDCLNERAAYAQHAAFLVLHACCSQEKLW